MNFQRRNIERKIVLTATGARARIVLVMLMMIAIAAMVPGIYGKSVSGSMAPQQPTTDSLSLIYNDIDAADFPRIVSLVMVMNEAGMVVGELDEDNFEVYEDNVRELPITVEELTAGEVGINVVLTIDRSGSMRGQPIQDAITASSTFVTLMQERDKSAVVSFSHDVRTDYPFTNNQDSLIAAISGIKAQGGTAIFDALIHSVYLISSDLKNRAIILLTDGADNDSRYTYQEALTALLSHEVRVFCIGLGLNRNSPEENILKELADSTGGLYYYSPTSSDLEAIYRAISHLLHHRYRVTYSTHNTAKDGTRRHVRIAVDVRSNTSSDTASYIAPYEAPPDPPPPDPPPPDPPPPDPPPPDPPPPDPPPPDPPEEDSFEVIPNPFTPNDDGFNYQVEFKKGDDLPANWTIIILDRAGREIKRLANGLHFWNGTDESGKLMVPGSYLYLVFQDEQILHRGLIQLIR